MPAVLPLKSNTGCFLYHSVQWAAELTELTQFLYLCELLQCVRTSTKRTAVLAGSCQVKCKQQHLQLFCFPSLFTQSAAQQAALDLPDILLLSFWSGPIFQPKKMRRVLSFFSIFIFGVNGRRLRLFWCSRVEDVMRADWLRLQPQLSFPRNVLSFVLSLM